MLLRIEEEPTLVDVSTLKSIGGGKDGNVFEYENEAIKVVTSNYMTEEKIKDLRSIISEGENTRIILPRRIAYDPIVERKKLISTPATAYTQLLKREIPNGILTMSSVDYLDEALSLRAEVENYFGKNAVALMDTNPNNLLPSNFSGKTRLYLVDHDRDITPSSMYSEKVRIKGNDYLSHNDKRLALIIYKGLLLQLQKLEGIGSDEVEIVGSYIEYEKERSDITFNTTKKALEGYASVLEYAKGTLRKIKSK